ncbi:MAG: hypothetical protein ACI93H_001824, partial [Psychromonas sp.]
EIGELYPGQFRLGEFVSESHNDNKLSNHRICSLQVVS